jgi:hypothetical protein
MERHNGAEGGSPRVIPVILRPLDWKGAPFGKLEALPPGARPVTTWANRDEALKSVAEGVRELAEGLRGVAQAEPPTRTKGADPLFYLLDRYDQEKSLLLAVEEHARRNPRRPLVCILHGRSEEMPEGFRARMHEEPLLGKISRSWRSDTVRRAPAPQFVPMHLSLRGLGSRNRAHRDSVFMKDLSMALAGVPSASPVELVRGAGRDVAFIVGVVTPRYEDLSGNGFSVLDDFIRFWDGLELPESQVFIVCISFRYCGRGWWPLRLRKAERISSRLERYVRGLASRTALRCVALPEMRSVSEDEAAMALEHEAVTESHPRLTKEIVSDIYSAGGLCATGDCIPFRKLYYELKKC